MTALLAALQRMAKAADGPVAASQFTAAQRKALDQFIQQTHAITCRTSGRGITYKVAQPSYCQIWCMSIRRRLCRIDHPPVLHPETERYSRPASVG